MRWKDGRRSGNIEDRRGVRLSGKAKGGGIGLLVLVLVGLQAGISLPAIPGTIGLFEYICILALSVFGVDQSLALSFGLLLHAIVLIPTTLAGIASFWVLGLFGQRKKYQDIVAQ